MLLCNITLTVRVLLYFTSVYLCLYLLTLRPVYSPITLLSHAPQFFVIIFHLRSELQLQLPLRASLTTMCSLVSRVFIQPSDTRWVRASNRVVIIELIERKARCFPFPELPEPVSDLGSQSQLLSGPTTEPYVYLSLERTDLFVVAVCRTRPMQVGNHWSTNG